MRCSQYRPPFLEIGALAALTIYAIIALNC